MGISDETAKIRPGGDAQPACRHAALKPRTSLSSSADRSRPASVPCLSTRHGAVAPRSSRTRATSQRGTAIPMLSNPAPTFDAEPGTRTARAVRAAPGRSVGGGRGGTGIREGSERTTSDNAPGSPCEPQHSGTGRGDSGSALCPHVPSSTSAEESGPLQTCAAENRDDADHATSASVALDSEQNNETA